MEPLKQPYNYDADMASEESGLECKDGSRTQQEFAKETDINYIAARFGLTGQLPQVLQLPTYGDFTGIFDYQTALNVVNDAKQDFMTLPAKIRSRFNNNPQELLEFMDDDANTDEAIALGLATKPPAPPPAEETITGGTPPATP